MVKRLPVFRGWTVDVRLRQFRKASPASGIVFLDFDSEEGDALLDSFVASLDSSTPEGKDLLVELWR